MTNLVEFVISDLYSARWADAKSDYIRSTPRQIGDRPYVVEVLVRKIAMAWWCEITISKQIEDGCVVDHDEFICGGANGPIRWDAVKEAVRDKVSPYLY